MQDSINYFISSKEIEKRMDSRASVTEEKMDEHGEEMGPTKNEPIE